MPLSTNSTYRGWYLKEWLPRRRAGLRIIPRSLLKLYIYGYLNRVQLSRRLERETGRNVEVMWLTGRLTPDHKTIADFRKDSGGAIKRSACNLLNCVA